MVTGREHFGVDNPQPSPRLGATAQHATRTDDLAREPARLADSELQAARYRGPLHRIPFAIQDRTSLQVVIDGVLRMQLFGKIPLNRSSHILRALSLALRTFETAGANDRFRTATDREPSNRPGPAMRMLSRAMPSSAATRT